MNSKGLLSGIHGWLAHPFADGAENGTAYEWVLFIGLLIVAIWMWSSVIRLIQRQQIIGAIKEAV